ncbi:MAG: hypothetical protein R3F39_10255 [Myxococcota bacterium]
MTANHKLTEEYQDRVGRLAALFPAAHAFLRRLEGEGPSHRLWLSTSVNAHLYKGDGFLAYLKIKNPELRPPSLVLSPKFNHRIAGHTTDQSRRLFPRVVDTVLRASGGEAAPWAIRLANGATELTVKAPVQLFDGLFDALSTLDVA